MTHPHACVRVTYVVPGRGVPNRVISPRDIVMNGEGSTVLSAVPGFGRVVQR